MLIRRYGNCKTQETITAEVLSKLISCPPYTTSRSLINGKVRELSIPSRELKMVLRVILKNIFDYFGVSGFAHGGVCEKSIVTNAEIHLGAKSIFKIDFRHYYPSITQKMVVDCLSRLLEKNVGCIATLENCGMSSFREARGLAGIIGRLATHKGVLPQGAPTSSCLQNLIFRDLDEKISKVAEKYFLRYTRFVDDLTFSSAWPEISQSALNEIMALIKNEVGEFLKLNRKKIHYRKGKREVHKITGVTIVPGLDNISKTSLTRRQIERYRSVLHLASLGRVSTDQAWGVIAFVRMVCGEGIPNRLRKPFTQFLTNCYPDSWDRRIEPYKNWL
ncbi:MAG: reverse transcriptase family protein [Patescibacteria group bacterium]